MRIWHYKLIPFLPNSQLIAQWRELNSIFKKQDKHILINYVYEYPNKDDLFSFATIVTLEMAERGIAIHSWDNYYTYFNEKNYKLTLHPFARYHNDRYLKQCFYNLQEKFDRGQRDFSLEQYKKLYGAVFGE